MTYFITSQLGSIEDKTKLKGVYFFLSFSIVILLFFKLGFIDFQIVLNPLSSIYIFFAIFMISSLSTAFLHYLRFETLILKNYLRFKAKILEYYPYKNVTFFDGFNHPFILIDKNNFLSKVLFCFSLILLSFLFFDNNAILYFSIIFIIFIIIDIPLIIIKNSRYQKEAKTSYKREIRKITYMLKNHFIVTFFGLFITIFYTFLLIQIGSLIFLLFIFLIIPLFISFSFDWNNLQIKLRLIYIMNLFQQDGNMIKEPLVKEFVDNIKNNLWYEATYNFNNILDHFFGEILKQDIIKRNILFNYPIRIITLILDHFKLGYPREILPEDYNIINIHYAKHVFSYIFRAIKGFDKLDNWIEIILLKNNYPKYFEPPFKIIMSTINKELENITKIQKNQDYDKKLIDFSIELSKNELIVNSLREQDYINKFEVEYYSFFMSLLKCTNLLEEKVTSFRKELKIKSIKMYDKILNKKAKKLKKLIERNKDKIINVLTELKLKGTLEKFLQDNLQEDFVKISQYWKDYKIGVFSDEIFIRLSVDTLGQKFFHIFNKYI